MWIYSQYGFVLIVVIINYVILCGLMLIHFLFHVGYHKPSYFMCHYGHKFYLNLGLWDHVNLCGNLTNFDLYLSW